MIVVPAERMREVSASLLAKAGMPLGDAATVSDSMLEASLRGVDSHGFSYLPLYLQRIRLGGTNPKPRPRIVRLSAATAVMDGDGGAGPVVARAAMSTAVLECNRSGVFFVSCRNSTTFGAAFYYSMMAAREGKIGIAMCNAPPAMAAWGGKDAVLGTNPLSVAVPGRQGPAIVLDMATSAAAKSKIYLAAQKGEPIPEGWALDSEGRPTTDPSEALKGVVLPLAGPKGSGLALIVDVLCGALSGGGCGHRVRSLHRAPEKYQNVSFFVGVIDPAAFNGTAGFFDEVERLTCAIRNSTPAQGFDRVYLPGEIEEMRREQRLRDGILLPESVVEEIRREASYLGETRRLL